MDYVPSFAPKGRVMDWSDERRDGNPIMVTLARGFAFYDNVRPGEDGDACHVSGFDTKREALAAIRRAEPCQCARCRGEEGEG